MTTETHGSQKNTTVSGRRGDPGHFKMPQKMQPGFAKCSRLWLLGLWVWWLAVYHEGIVAWVEEGLLQLVKRHHKLLSASQRLSLKNQPSIFVFSSFQQVGERYVHGLESGRGQQKQQQHDHHHLEMIGR